MIKLTVRIDDTNTISPEYMGTLITLKLTTSRNELVTSTMSLTSQEIENSSLVDILLEHLVHNLKKEISALQRRRGE